jgi:purine-binding chemotaxis protein CheW
MSQFVTFRLAGQLMGMDILLVREINQIMESTYVQRAPEFIIGLINLRGQIVTIFDLARRLGMPSMPTEESHNIILKSNSELVSIRLRENKDNLFSADEVVGLRVDAIGDVMEMDYQRIEPAPANIGFFDQHFLAGVVPLEDELLIILDVGAVLRKDFDTAA